MSDRCPEAFRHGPADGQGRCPWCRIRYTNPAPDPGSVGPSDLTTEYGQFYNPDFEALGPEEIRKKLRTGGQWE